VYKYLFKKPALWYWRCSLVVEYFSILHKACVRSLALKNNQSAKQTNKNLLSNQTSQIIRTSTTCFLSYVESKVGEDMKVEGGL
jgi:hypothetical protein